jgi:hypothetical protein
LEEPAGASLSARMTASAATNLMITRKRALRGLSACLYSCNVVNIYGGKSGEGGQQNQSREVGNHFPAKVVRTLSAHLVSREVKQPANVLIAASIVLPITTACQCPRSKVQNLRIVVLTGFHPTTSANKRSNARITIPSETRPSRGP